MSDNKPSDREIARLPRNHPLRKARRWAALCRMSFVLAVPCVVFVGMYDTSANGVWVTPVVVILAVGISCAALCIFSAVYVFGNRQAAQRLAEEQEAQRAQGEPAEVVEVKPDVPATKPTEVIDATELAAAPVPFEKSADEAIALLGQPATWPVRAQTEQSDAGRDQSDGAVVVEVSRPVDATPQPPSPRRPLIGDQLAARRTAPSDDTSAPVPAGTTTRE